MHACRTNHMDGQIFTPPYLLNPDGSLAARPNITMAPAGSAHPGDVLSVVTDTLIASFSIIRRGCEFWSHPEAWPHPCPGSYLLASQARSEAMGSHKLLASMPCQGACLAAAVSPAGLYAVIRCILQVLAASSFAPKAARAFS